MSGRMASSAEGLAPCLVGERNELVELAAQVGRFGGEDELVEAGKRFIAGMPTLASVTPAVPPKMIISAGMLMNEAGLVPSISELSRSETKASPMPMAVAAFIVPIIGARSESFGCWGPSAANGASARLCAGAGTRSAARLGLHG